jgi:hypothetical protein
MKIRLEDGKIVDVADYNCPHMFCFSLGYYHEEQKYECSYRCQWGCPSLGTCNNCSSNIAPHANLAFCDNCGSIDIKLLIKPGIELQLIRTRTIMQPLRLSVFPTFRELSHVIDDKLLHEIQMRLFHASQFWSNMHNIIQGLAPYSSAGARML